MTDISLPSAKAPLNGDARPVPRPQAAWGAWSLRFAALSYLAVFIAVPLLAIGVEGLGGGLETFVTSITRPAALNAVWLSVWTAAVMTVINTVMGTLTAYVLTMYKFPGKAVFNAL